MVVFNLKTLIQKKSHTDKTKYTYKDIEEITGIKSYRLSRINSTTDYNIDIKDLEKLCNYFNCTPNDLISIYPDKTD
ncbi:XRE family transcriptional regulator [Candidatus Magnetomorum sp. HK-1]|nr:XRE family transcriptional regulator [Candidatus Magnetomorum sp. HK-1]